MDLKTIFDRIWCPAVPGVVAQRLERLVVNQEVASSNLVDPAFTFTFELLVYSCLMSNKKVVRIWTLTPEVIEKERKWIESKASVIGVKKLQYLAKLASKARKVSYSPYSKYKVGAAVLTASGLEVSGQNIEVVTYSETGHAEEQAIKNAVSKGEVVLSGRRFVRAIAVSHKGDTAPCGRCRQIISEFSDNSLVVIADDKGKVRSVTSIKSLLPYAFTPSDLVNK